MLSGRSGKITQVNEKPINTLSNTSDSKEIHICTTKLHLQKTSFPSKQLLQAHVIWQHKCPFVTCAFYHMFEGENYEK